MTEFIQKVMMKEGAVVLVGMRKKEREYIIQSNRKNLTGTTIQPKKVEIGCMRKENNLCVTFYFMIRTHS